MSKGDGTQQTEENGAEEKKAPKIDGLKYQKTMQLKYATGFDVYYYKGGYKLLDVHDDRQYLIVPKGKKKPADLEPAEAALLIGLSNSPAAYNPVAHPKEARTREFLQKISHTE